MNANSGPSRITPLLLNSLLIMLIVAALFVFSDSLGRFSQNANLATHTPIPMATTGAPPVSGYPPPILTSAYPTDYPPAKASLEAQIEQTRNAALVGTLPPTNAKELPPTPPGTESPWPTGIIEDGESPFSASFVFRNRWQEILDGQHVIVYAGSVKSDSSQGVILVWEVSPDFSNSVDNVYPSPVTDGPLQIVAVDNLRLVLETQNGLTLYFDVPSRQFVDSLTATPPPTITHLPSPSPLPPPTAYPVITNMPVSTATAVP